KEPKPAITNTKPRMPNRIRGFCFYRFRAARSWGRVPTDRARTHAALSWKIPCFGVHPGHRDGHRGGEGLPRSDRDPLRRGPLAPLLQSRTDRSAVQVLDGPEQRV